MIKTEIFEHVHTSDYICLEQSLRIVNNFIDEKEITKSDIIEYRTEKWTEHAGTHFVHYRITLSWCE